MSRTQKITGNYIIAICVLHTIMKKTFTCFQMPSALFKKNNNNFTDSAKYLLPYGFLFLPPSLEIISPSWLRCVSFMFYAVTVAMFLPPPHHVSVGLHKYRSCILIEYMNKWVYSFILLRNNEALPFFFLLAPIFLEWVLLEQTFYASVSLSGEHTIEELGLLRNHKRTF